MALPAEEWRRLLEAAAAPEVVTALDFVKPLPGFSSSVLLTCDDGRDYAVKGLQPAKMNMGRALVAEQVVGSLGRHLGAPVAEVGLVSISDELREAQQDLQHMEAGIAHGCAWLPKCSERAWVSPETVQANRERLAKLAILYGLAGAHDHQLIFENEAPNLAHSVDHGHFLPPFAARWDEASLRARGEFPPDDRLVRDCALTQAELRRAAVALVELDPTAIARTVRRPPDDWGVTIDERIALCDYFERGAEAMKQTLGLEDGDAEHDEEGAA